MSVIYVVSFSDKKLAFFRIVCMHYRIVTGFSALERAQDALQENFGKCRVADESLLQDLLEDDRSSHVKFGGGRGQGLLYLRQNSRDAGMSIFG